MAHRSKRAETWAETAKKLLSLPALSDEQFREGIKVTQAHLDALNLIAAGHPPRNALSILNAMKLKLDFGYARPRQELHVRDLTLEQLLRQTMGIPEPEEGETDDLDDEAVARALSTTH